MNAKLIVVGGEAKTKEVKLKFPCIIGRGKGATLLLPHPLVSRQHCEIFESNGHLMVRDLGSLNGTYVNNEKVEEGHLAPGQLLTVGSVTFRADYQNEQAERVPTDRATVATSATAAMKAMPATVPTPVPVEVEPEVEIESVSEPYIEEEIPVRGTDVEGAAAELDAPLDDDFEGLSSEPLFQPDPPKPAASKPAAPKPVAQQPAAPPSAAPMAKPAPMAIPVAAPPPAAEAEEEEPVDDDDDLNDFLNSLGSK